MSRSVQSAQGHVRAALALAVLAPLALAGCGGGGGNSAVSSPIAPPPDAKPFYVYKSQIGGPGAGDGQFNGPISIAVANDIVYIGDLGMPSGAEDYSGSRIEAFRTDGTYLNKFLGQGVDTLHAPFGIAVTPAGALAVSDRGGAGRTQLFGGFVALYHSDGSLIQDLGYTGQGQMGNSRIPVDVAVDGAGSIYVLNYDLSTTINPGTVEVFKSDGTPSPKFSTLDATPAGIALDGLGSIYVTDSTQSRVLVFGTDGFLRRTFGTKGNGAGQLIGPSAIAIAANGNVFVLDGDRRVEVFKNDGTYLAQFALQNVNQYGASAPTIYAPKMAFDGSGSLYIVDDNNRRVQVFQPAP